MKPLNVNQCVRDNDGLYRVSGNFTADEILEIASGIALQALMGREEAVLTDTRYSRQLFSQLVGKS